MKKLMTLLAVGCMVLGSLDIATAVDVKVSGQWFFHYGYYSNNGLVANKDSGSHQDRTRARQRVRTQIQFIADENLRAMLNLEANMDWGKSNNEINGGGGTIDADQTVFVIKHAYMDWTIPDTRTNIRMGMQGIAFPYVAFGNPAMNADVAGVTVSNQLTPELGLTAFWARPYDSSYSTAGQTGGKNLYDDVDMFGVMVPIKTDYVRATPWASFALIGRDSDFYTAPTKNRNNYRRGTLLPKTGGKVDTSSFDSTTYAWWAGATLELPVIDPFFVKLDLMMGSLDTGNSDYDTFGWMLVGDMGYKFSFGSLSAIGWYATGDKDKDDLGTMPIMSDDTSLRISRLGMAEGAMGRSFDRLLSGSGLGMWGIGFKLADVSFLDRLKHTVVGLYMGGTNKGDSWENNRSLTAAVGSQSYFGQGSLMSSDRAWEFNLLNQYKVNDNLTVNVDFGYLWLDLGPQWDSDDTTGTFATMLGVVYRF